MKKFDEKTKTGLAVAVCGVIFAIGMFIITPIEATNQKKITPINESQINPSNFIPEDVAEVLRGLCMSCHEAGGNGMAMLKWKFSSWDNYPAKKQTKLSLAMCNAVTKATMPPTWVRQSNPDRIPNAAQTEIICKWAGASNFFIPENVAEVLGNSCVSCHGANGNVMAMSSWNFSTWDKNPAKKQISQAKAICNAMTNGSMPPSWVRQSNPDRIPNLSQTEIVCNWAG